jgi:hypothetical protein
MQNLQTHLIERGKKSDFSERNSASAFTFGFETLVRSSQIELTASAVSNTSRRHCEDGVKGKLAGRVVGLGRTRTSHLLRRAVPFSSAPRTYRIPFPRDDRTTRCGSRSRAGAAVASSPRSEQRWRCAPQPNSGRVKCVGGRARKFAKGHTEQPAFRMRLRCHATASRCRRFGMASGARVAAAREGDVGERVVRWRRRYLLDGRARTARPGALDHRNGGTGSSRGARGATRHVFEHEPSPAASTTPHTRPWRG